MGYMIKAAMNAAGLSDLTDLRMRLGVSTIVSCATFFFSFRLRLYLCFTTLPQYQGCIYFIVINIYGYLLDITLKLLVNLTFTVYCLKLSCI